MGYVIKMFISFVLYVLMGMITLKVASFYQNKKKKNEVTSKEWVCIVVGTIICMGLGLFYMDSWLKAMDHYNVIINDYYTN